VRKTLMRQFTQAARRRSPPTMAERWSGSGSLTRAGRPKTAMLATSLTRGGRATRRHGRRQATTSRTTSFPQCFRQPTSIGQYTGETDPRVWLNDYRLACQLGVATTDEVIIRNLLLHLADSAWTWL
jgi:hypothetical protein